MLYHDNCIILLYTISQSQVDRLSCREAYHRASSRIRKPLLKKSTILNACKWRMWPKYGEVFSFVFLSKEMASNASLVYSLNSAHMRDDEAARLENFFWRIWSNRSIIRSIRGSTLARLFITISEGGNRVRTTPVPTPLPTPLATTPTQNLVSSFWNLKSFHLLTSQTFTSAAPLRRSSATASVENRETPTATSSQIDAGVLPRRTSDQSQTLPPILKKSRTGSDDPPKIARIIPSGTEVRDAGTKSTRRKSSESAATLSPPLAAVEKSGKNAAKKRTSGISAVGTRKGRPGVVRKRSSQTSGPTEQRRSSQTSPYIAAQLGKTTPKLAVGLPPPMSKSELFDSRPSYTVELYAPLSLKKLTCYSQRSFCSPFKFVAGRRFSIFVS